MLLLCIDFLLLQLLDYVTTTIFFSDQNVDSNLISWNRVVLLHGKWLTRSARQYLIVDLGSMCHKRFILVRSGPPGTGKTSLCKALAQKLSIRLSNRYDNSNLRDNAPSVAAPTFIISKLPLSHCRYSYGQFVEINSHSLFSKWFSEVCLCFLLPLLLILRILSGDCSFFSQSGKLVTKMFQKIQQLIDDKDALVFVLIDEVIYARHISPLISVPCALLEELGEELPFF